MKSSASKRCITAALAVVSLATVLLIVTPTRGSILNPVVHNPWLNINEDKLMDILDNDSVARVCGTSAENVSKASSPDGNGWLDMRSETREQYVLAHNLNASGLRVDAREITSRFDKVYGGTLSDSAEALIQTADGGYALAGVTYSFGAGNGDFWLVKTDATGNIQWNRTYGGTNGDCAFDMVQTSDGGYALAGVTYSFGAGNADFWLVKTDASGVALWNSTYGGTSNDVAYALAQSTDGGYALAGHSSSFGAGSDDFWLVKTDATGNVQSNRTYGGTNGDYAFAMVQTSDGGYALAGVTYSFGAGNADFWLVKTDATGNIQWNRTYGGEGWEEAYALVQASDGGYTLAGLKVPYGSGYSDCWVVKTDPTGNMEWNRTYKGRKDDEAFALVQTTDGGYALAIWTASFGAGNGDCWLVKTDELGNMQWNRTYGGVGNDSPFALVQTSDGGYAFAGMTYSVSAGSNDFWLVKTPRDVSAIIVPDDYPKIQDAINNAIDGDTILVKAGVYYEHVIVNKTISLVGENSSTTIVDGNWTGVVINVTRNGVIVSGLTVQRSGSVHWENAGIFLGNVENCSIHANILTQNSFAGLELNYSHRCNIFENSIISNGGVGITLVGGSSNELSRNNFAQNGWSALTLNDESNKNTIYENNMTSNNQAVTGHCINLYRSSNNSIQKNNIARDDNGVRLEYWSNFNTISRNSIADNTQAGVSVEKYSNYNTILQNNISQNGYGFYIEDSTQNTIWGNNIVDNDLQVNITSTSTNVWDNGYPSGGNYWSDYSGLDQFSGPYQNVTGSDQIGDSPYIVDAANKDNYPLMNPWVPQALSTDINNDGIVNIVDITIVAKAFGSKPGDLNWNAISDLDKNVLINIVDITLVAKDYGKTA